METHNTKILNFLCENAQMGVQTISKMLENIVGENPKLEEVLGSQLSRYSEFDAQASQHLRSRGGEAKPIPRMTTFISDMMIDFKTMNDKSTSHIAEMMLKGSTMGIISVTKTINENKSADAELLSLANDLLIYQTEQFEILRLLL